MGDPFTIAAIATIGAGVGLKTYAANEANDARIQALKTREQQESIAGKEKSLQRTSQLMKIISTQEAQAGARGVSVSSPSFQAIGEESFNQWAQDERTDAMNTEMSREAYQGEIHGLRTANTMNIFGAVTDFGSSVLTPFAQTKLGQNQSLASNILQPDTEDEKLKKQQPLVIKKGL
jgi:hypothetical protein